MEDLLLQLDRLVSSVRETSIRRAPLAVAAGVALLIFFSVGRASFGINLIITNSRTSGATPPTQTLGSPSLLSTGTPQIPRR